MTSERTAADVTGLLRDALAALHDPVRLRRHPLVAILPAITAGEHVRDADGLRGRLLAAIESLRPPDDRPGPTRSRERHRLLTLRYQEALPVADVCRQLNVSRSEYYRQQADALEMLRAALLPDAGAPNRSNAMELPGSVYGRTFVGRDTELERLHEAFDAARTGVGGLAMIMGEPGIGKSALVARLTDYAVRNGGLALVGHSYEAGSLSAPYLPFVEALGAYVADHGSHVLEEDLGAGAMDVARILPGLQDQVSVGASPEGDPEAQRWRLFQSLLGFLRNIAHRQPLLLVLEDLHDADRGTLDLLIHVSRNLPRVPLLLAGTYRDVGVSRGHPLAGTLAELYRGGNFLRLPLRGLSVGEVQRMMGEVTKTAIPLPLAELVHQRTEGNPLFAQETLRYLLEVRMVHEHDGALRTVEEGAWPGRIPEGLRDVIGKRLSRLSERTNQVLATAAVMGPEFRMDVLPRVTGLSEDEIEQALEEAIAIAVVEPSAAIPTVGFRFTHAFFRQTLYEELFPARRLRLHQHVARALEQVYAAEADEHAAELAEHFAASTDRDDLRRALAYAEVAAQRATQVYAYGEAVNQLGRALRLQETADRDDLMKRCDLLLAYAEALMPAGELRRVTDQVAPEAFRLAERHGDDARAARVARIAVEAYYQFGALGGSMSPAYPEWANRLDRLAAPGSEDRIFANLALAALQRLAMGSVSARRWPGVPSSSRIEEALELARALEHREGAFRAAFALTWPAAICHRSRQRAIADEFVQATSGGVSPSTLGSFYSGCSRVFLDWGERPAAETATQRLIELANHTGNANAVLEAMHSAILYATLDGRLEEAVEEAKRFLQRAEELGATRFGNTFTAMLTLRAHLYRGQEEAAIADAQRLVAERGRPSFITECRGALLHATLGQPIQAHRAITSIVATCGPETWLEETMYYPLVYLLEAAVLVQDREHAAALAEVLTVASDSPTGFHAFTCVARHLGAAAALLGDPAAALGYYEQAIQVCTRIGFRPEIALTHLQLAELLGEHYHDRNAEAQIHLDMAIPEFHAMSMQPYLERAMRYMGQFDT